METSTLRVDIVGFLNGRISGCALTAAIHAKTRGHSPASVHKTLQRMRGHELSTTSARGIHCLDRPLTLYWVSTPR